MNICTLNKLYKEKCYLNIKLLERKILEIGVDKNIVIIEIKVSFSLSEMD